MKWGQVKVMSSRHQLKKGPHHYGLKCGSHSHSQTARKCRLLETQNQTQHTIGNGNRPSKDIGKSTVLGAIDFQGNTSGFGRNRHDVDQPLQTVESAATITDIIGGASVVLAVYMASTRLQHKKIFGHRR